MPTRSNSISFPTQELVLVSSPLVHALPSPSRSGAPPPPPPHPPPSCLTLQPFLAASATAPLSSRGRAGPDRRRSGAFLVSELPLVLVFDRSNLSPQSLHLPVLDSDSLPRSCCRLASSRGVARRGGWVPDWGSAGAGMNTRPVVLVLLLLVLIITSQFEWKQQIGDAADADPAAARRRQQLLAREDAVKEKIILSQEKNIQQLNQLIESLQRQLLHCRGSNSTVHTTTVPATEVAEVEEHETIDDENR
ncbi:unnamed protein product [Urochloa decumbens]|uniref:Uncharacterized protein n=2 Tax=Urochloa decumbens TaxID=240449 RepID=A0ABC9F0T8_9POAL